METVKSKDGTIIAYDRYGSGPALILVAGALGTRASWNELGSTLSPSFTVYGYDRRGRIDSTNTVPYAVQREIEDIEALIDTAGGSAALFGISSGAVLALHAADALPGKVTGLVMYEPPIIVDDSHPRLPDDYIERLDTLVKEGKRGEAVEYFMTAAVGVPAEYIAPMKQDPMWSGMEAVAHTIQYDGQVMGSTMSGNSLPANRWPNVTAPVLVVVGGNSEQFFHTGGKAVTDNLNGKAEFQVLPGQDHNVAASAIAPLIVEFLNR